MMRGIPMGLAAILLTTAASCVSAPRGTRVAKHPSASSHFYVVDESAPQGERMGVAPSATRMAESAAADDDVALAAGSERKENAVRTAEFEPPVPPPAPSASEDSAAKPSQAEEKSAVLTPGSAPAEGAMELEAAPGEVGLALEEAISIALNANPTIGQSRASVRRTEHVWDQMGFYPNPTAGYVSTEVGNNGNGGQQGVYLGQVFVTADKLDWNRSVASGAVGFAEAQVQSQRLRVITDTTIRYYTALGKQRLIVIAEKIQDNAQRGYDATKSLVDAGESAKADLLQAGAILQRAKVGVRQAEARAEGAWRQLAAMMGQPKRARPHLTGTLEQMPNDVPFEVLWERLKNQSPELKAAAANVARARGKIGRENAQAVPNVSTQNFLQYDTDTQSTIVGLQWTVPVPIIHQNNGARGAAYSAHVRACREYERTKLELRNRLAQTVRDVEVAQVQVVTYRKKVIPAATESLELVRSAYKLGQYSVIRLLASQQIYAQAAAEYVQALIDLRSAEARVDGLLLTGGLNAPTAPENLGGFNGLSQTPRAQ